MQCIVCTSEHFSEFYKTNVTAKDLKRYQITENTPRFYGAMLKCRLCGVVSITFDTPYLTKLLTNYKHSGQDVVYIAEEQQRRRTARNLLKKINTFFPDRKGKLLELGCYIGSFLFEAKCSGWEVYGIDLSHWAAREAQRRYNLSIHNGDAIQTLAQFSDHSFEVIVALDFIEHLPKPQELIDLLHKKLKPGGLFIITTPDINSITARLFGKQWYAIVPSHLHYFSKSSIRYLLENGGFTITQYKYHTRYFSLWYLGYRLSGFSFPLARFLGGIFNSEFFNQRNV